MRPNHINESVLNRHITIDLDWCSDDTLDYVRTLLRTASGRATWFATHASPVVTEQIMGTQDEVGIHPNFLPGSTHGTTENEILLHMKKLFPESIAMRSHCLYQHARVLEMATEQFGICIDASLFLPGHPHLQIPEPLRYGQNSLVRVPYFWEDDVEMRKPTPCFSLRTDSHKVSGLKIYNVHPAIVALNLSEISQYQTLLAKRDLRTWDRRFILENQRSGRGMLDFFIELVESTPNGKTISEIAKGA